MDSQTEANLNRLSGDVHFLTAPFRFIWHSILWILFLTAAPLLYLTIPFLLIAFDPHGYFSVLAGIYMLLGPLIAAFWMLVSCHWPTVRRARLEGRLSTWREDAGGYGRTMPKAFGFMFLGLFGSMIAEIVFCGMFSVPNGNPWGAALYFATAPFATFAPVILLWLFRRMRRQKEYRRIDG